jgi:hypothetical protein
MLFEPKLVDFSARFKSEMGRSKHCFIEVHETTGKNQEDTCQGPKANHQVDYCGG